MSKPDCPVCETVSRWTRRKEARPTEILDAALDCFVERGFAGTRMEDIARRAGVTAGTIYRYYANKEEVFKAVVRESLLPTVVEGEQLVANFQGSPSALLAQVVREWWRLMGATQLSGLPKLMISESRNFPELARFYHDEVVARAEAMVARVIEAGIAAGEFRPMPTEIGVKLVGAPLIMAMVWQHSFGVCDLGEIDTARYIEELVQTLLHGLKPVPHSTGA
jgi:AcrR family transcriptional regulator